MFWKVFVILWPSISAANNGLLPPEIHKDLLTPLREAGETCGYESCPLTKPGFLNVHIVPNTHMELGYGNNIDEHYTGEDEFFAPRQSNAQKILDAVLSELWANPSRRFTLSDTAYLFYWWARRDATVRRMVFQLLRQGRLFLVGGGFSMSDEASVSYQAVIDHFTYSLRKINATFMECGRPLVAWQADVFGHSREFASLMAQMGFDGLFINPISYDDEAGRMRRAGLEFLWRGSDELGQDSDIFTHKLFDGYWPPPGFCFSKLCNSTTDPLLITSDSLFRNVKERAQAFINSMRFRQGPSYATNHVMVMMGHKFSFFDAATWFENTEALINHVNKESLEKGLNISLFYSTPPCYLQSVNEENPPLETKQDDFFPLSYDSNTYLVGMYTSRPTLKYIIREAFVYLQIAKQLQVTANMGNNDQFFESFMWIMSIMQDHGIASGAMKDRVKDYYVSKLYASVTRSTFLMSRAFRKLRNGTMKVNYARCMFNISSCNETRYIKYSLQIYNPLGWPVTTHVRLPCIIRNSKFNVYDHKGDRVNSVTMKTAKPFLSIKGRTATDHEVVFTAEDIPPVGFRSYYVEAHYWDMGRAKRSLTKGEKVPNKKYNATINHLHTDDDNTHFDTEYEIYEDLFNASARNKGNYTFRMDTDYEYEMFDKPEFPANNTVTLRPEINMTHDTSVTFNPDVKELVRTSINSTNSNDGTAIDKINTNKADTHNVNVLGIDADTPVTNATANKIAEAITTTESVNNDVVTDVTTNDLATEAATDKIDTDPVKIEITTEPVTNEVATEVVTDESTTIAPAGTLKIESEPTIEVTTEEFTTEPMTNENPFEYIPDITTEASRKHLKDSHKYFEVKDDSHNLFIGNKYIRLNLNTHNRIAGIHLCNGLNISLTVQLYYYVSDEPQNLDREGVKNPGVLNFRPIDPQVVPMDTDYEAEVVKNDIVEELHVKYNEWAFLIVRLYADSAVVELNWLVGPIPITDGLGKDVFIKYSTDLGNEGVFYTDANGRQTIKRIRNKRATYQPYAMDEITGNLYPVTSKIYIEDVKRNTRFTVFNDRSQAGGSLADGTIDLMVHRRILTQDVSDARILLNETEHGEGIRVVGTHYLYLTKADHKKNRIFEKKFAKEIEMAPRVLASYRTDYKPDMKREFYASRNEFSAVKKLPVGVHLLTLEKWAEKILIRLENYLELSDVLSTGVKTVFLKELFNDIDILSINETTLGANMYQSERAPRQWTKKERFFSNFNDNYGVDEPTFEGDYVPNEEDSLEVGIKLRPQQIRTFVAEYRYRDNK